MIISDLFISISLMDLRRDLLVYDLFIKIPNKLYIYSKKNTFLGCPEKTSREKHHKPIGVDLGF